MRRTLTQQILLGVSVLLLLGLGALAVLYQALTTVARALTEVTEVEEPTSAAAYEMEINVVEIGLKVMKHLDTGNPQYRERVVEDTADFARFKAQYDRLAETEQGKALGEQVGAFYHEFLTVGEALMNQKGQQETHFVTIAANFATLDEIIDDRLQAHIDREGPDGQQKAEEAVALEADGGEVGTWLGNYLQTHEPEQQRVILTMRTTFGNT